MNSNNALWATVAAAIVGIVVSYLRRFDPSATRQQTINDARDLLTLLETWLRLPRSEVHAKEVAERAHQESTRILDSVLETFHGTASTRIHPLANALLLRSPARRIIWLPQLLFYFLTALLAIVFYQLKSGVKLQEPTLLILTLGTLVVVLRIGVELLDQRHRSKRSS